MYKVLNPNLTNEYFHHCLPLSTPDVAIVIPTYEGVCLFWKPISYMKIG